MSAFGLVKKPQRVRESQFIIKYTWSFNYCNTFETTRQLQLKFDVEYITSYRREQTSMCISQACSRHVGPGVVDGLKQYWVKSTW